MNTVKKAYSLKHMANTSKVKELLSLHNEYIRSAKQFLSHNIKKIMQGKKISNVDPFYKSINSRLTMRYRQVCQRQVVGIMESWESNFENALKRKIFKCVKDPDIRTKLFAINKRKTYRPFTATIDGHDLEITADVISLYKSIRKRLRASFKFPKIDNINIQMSNLVVDVQEDRDSTSFDFWLNISTLNKGTKTLVPLAGNKYFNESAGELSQSCNMIVDKKKQLVEFKLVKNIAVNYVPAPENNIIALDFGISTLFTSQFGDQYGQKFKEMLLHYDKKITELSANLQRQGINPNRSKKFRSLVKKARSYIKNEIHRCLNRIINTYRPIELVVESLDFREGGLSKKFNRIVSKCGRGVIKEKLKYFKEIGIKITSVNPMYSSQECSKCHIVNKSNRKNKIYKCDNCKTVLDADVNGARILLTRRSCKFFHSFVGKQETRQFLEEAFKKLNKLRNELVRQGRPYSWSGSSLFGNTS